MQQLRRWVPGPARDAVRAAAVRLEEASAKDIAFCSEFAFHGGVAVSEHGFQAEAELVRMRQAGLLDLQRDQAPPFAVTRVTLSPSARELLSGRARAPVTEAVPATPLPKEPKLDQNVRRHGFEVARGMITAAVKAELASWCAAAEPGGAAGLETRILTRISQIEAPFTS